VLSAATQGEVKGAMPVGLVLVAMAARFATGALRDDEVSAEKTRLGEDVPEFGVEIPF
jgi:hypothetical protein